MPRKIRVADLPEFDLAELLRSEEDIAAYLNSVIEEGDMAELAHALGLVARARGMSEIAKASVLPAKPCTRRCGQTPHHASTPSTGSALPWGFGWWRRRFMHESAVTVL